MEIPNTQMHFDAQPLTDRCDRVRRRADHALIGVSTGNSYFSTERMTGLLRWAQRHFRAIDVVCADLHVDTMLVARGADQESAGRRARTRVKHVRRRIRQAVDAVSPDGPTPRTHLLSDFRDVPDYRRLRAAVGEALCRDPGFADACRDMVLRYLLGHRDATGENQERGSGNSREFQAGLEYLHSELPFFVDTPSILGVPSSVSCYHLSNPVVDALYLREEGLRAAENQAYMVVTPRGPQNSQRG